MATQASTTASERANWNEAEITALVDYLYEHRAEVGDGGSFKQPTYNAAAVAVAPLWKEGAKKTGTICKTKWGTIKSLYNCIDIYRNQSGFHWDNNHGANIVGVDAEAVWLSYLQGKNSVLRPFRNTGWSHFDKVQAIVPAGAGARGRHVFRPTIAQPHPSDHDQVSGSAGATAGSSDVPGRTGTIEASGSSSTAISETATTSGTTNDTSPLMISSSSSPTSVSTSKRTHSIMSAESTDPSIPSQPASSDATSSGNKKRQSSKLKSETVGSRAAISNAASKRSTSGRMANQASQAAAIMGMQGSINHLTDVFADSMRPAEDDVLSRRKHALTLLQTKEDLPPLDKARLAACFQKDISAADTYVSLVDPLVRAEWINIMLSS